MTEQTCPLHRLPDECLHNARLLAEGGHLRAATSKAPEARGRELPPVPASSVSLVLIANLINTWGRAAIDPTILRVDPADTRSVRYSLQAMSEATGSAPSRSPGPGLGEHYLPWSRIHDALSQAYLTAYGTAHPFADEKSTALTWYIALRQLEFARELWTEHIAPDQTEDLVTQ